MGRRLARNGSTGGSGDSGGGPGGFNRDAIRAGFQHHHIISHTNAATKDHPLLKAAGFDLQSLPNKIYLPKYEHQHSKRAIHNGRHSGPVMKTIGDEMTGIYNTGQAQGWTQAQYNSALRTMLSGLRQDLRAGNTALNSVHRPWATGP